MDIVKIKKQGKRNVSVVKASGILKLCRIA